MTNLLKAPMDSNVCARCQGYGEIQVPNGLSGPRGDAFDFEPCPDCEPRKPIRYFDSVFLDGVVWATGDRVSAEVSGDVWHGSITDIFDRHDGNVLASVELGNGLCAHIYLDLPLTSLVKPKVRAS